MVRGLLASGSPMHRALILLCVLALPVAAADLTPPVITPNVSGELGENGWYVSDVALAWSVSDGDSSARIRSGCESTFITDDTAGDTFL
jgi:hypothetical protein